MVAQPAIQQGKHLGENIIRMFQNKKMKYFEYKDKSYMAIVSNSKENKKLRENIIRIIKNKKNKYFEYKDKGYMATVGRNKAVVYMPHRTYTGAFAWFVWMFVHLWFLIGFRNRVVTFFNWSYNY